ncbi:BamA/TamA family outer membrane protein [Mangrovivirga sp. M17]|uniref:BamA/TamA family outer membrane protein n=1 Tax=Mangrovivirga halotolerans TaxID=2993936 RepID=A0ABT3RR75_9BACT|nr:BamA/TamA family outer membrane protein [Mangrovivirga halotolerans]MCX2744063.1 BamA/TamA family outer membrane protein [Mangrovivirga halotolerans]
MNRTILFYIIVSIFWFVTGCTGMKYVPEGDRMITDMNVDFEEKKNLYNSQTVKQTVHSLIEPQPNSKFLWMRTGVVINGLTPDKEKGVFYFIGNQIGSPPALLSNLKKEELIKVINNRLFHLGYFNVGTRVEIDTSKAKKAEVKFIIDTGEPYFIDTLVNDITSQTDTLNKIFDSSLKETKIDSGTYYQLERLERARRNIADYVNNRGYYYFSHEDIEFYADTTKLDSLKGVKLSLNLKANRKKRTLTYYTLDSVEVREDLPVEQEDTVEIKKDSIEDGIYLAEKREVPRYKPKHISEGIYFTPGKAYEKHERQKTYRYLTGMGAFNYVDIQLKPITNENKLKPVIGLYSLPKMSFSAEIGLNAKSNNFVGPGIKLIWLNRNFLHGAEQFTVSLNGNVERQFGGPPEQRQNSLSYEFGVETKLRVPRIWPSFVKVNITDYISFTEFSINANQYKRAGLYGLRTIQATEGYTWKGSETEDFYFYPFEVNYSSLFDQSDEFRDFLEENPFVRQTFSQQFILGLNLGYSNNQLEENLDNKRFYYSVDFQSAGNLVSLFDSNKQETGDEFLNVPYAQFLRLTQEYRKYFSVGRSGNDIATRVLVGVGYPYGNSRSLPYIRQYFIGGPNSLRGFRARTVGPGSYVNESEQLIYVDQTGDIRLEANVEYRKKLNQYFETAFFIDAGNIWLFTEDPDRPGADFKFDKFYEQIAVSTGVGLRINLSVIIIRFDLGFPLRKPFADQGFEWVFTDINPLDSDWRSNNLILNFSIGYPF